MTEIDEQILAIKKEIRETPHHKATEHYIGKLRAKLARLKDRADEQESRKTGGSGYAVKRQGDATVVLVGPPSSGKSTLLNKLTNAQSKVAPYEFTTVSVIPGMMNYRDAKIQILDVPGLIEGAEAGKGRGKEVLSVARGADLLIVMSDVERAKAIKRIEISLEENGIRVNKKKPEVKINKKLSGGVIIQSNIKQEISNETIREVVNEMGIKNAEIMINEKLTLDRLVDGLSKNRAYIASIEVLNKSDLDKKRVEGTEILMISAEKGTGLDVLRKRMWEKLGLIRIYLVRAGEEPSFKNPMIMREGDNLRRVAEKIGSEFAEDKTRARVWGEGAKFAGQEVSLKTEVKEGMMVRFI